MRKATEIKARILRPVASAPRIYFCGGGLPKSAPLSIPAGWQISTDKHPGPEYELTGVSAFRLRKDGTSVKLYRYELRLSVLDSYTQRREQIRLQRLAMDNAVIADTDRKLLERKNARNRSVAKKRGRKR